MSTRVAYFLMFVPGGLCKVDARVVDSEEDGHCEVVVFVLEGLGGDFAVDFVGGCLHMSVKELWK